MTETPGPVKRWNVCDILKMNLAERSRQRTDDVRFVTDEDHDAALAQVEAERDAIVAQLAALQVEHGKAITQLAECYRLSGADPDGNEDWRLAGHAVDAVAGLREESGNRAEAAEREAQRLRDALSALVQQWREASERIRQRKGHMMRELQGWEVLAIAADTLARLLGDA